MAATIEAVTGNLDSVVKADRKHLWHPWSPLAPRRERPLMTSARGCRVSDARGNTYLDLRAGSLNAAVGYGRSQVVEAIVRQAHELMTWDLGHATTIPAARLAARIAELAPGDLTRTLFCNSGSEAVEAAVKIARGWHALSGRPERTWVLSLRDGYHGSTLAGIAATGSPFRRTNAGPLPSGYAQIATPRCSDCGAGVIHPACQVPGADELESAIERYGPGQVAAFIVEPVLTAGGIIVPPEGYLRAVRNVCSRHGVLLIADEVVTGFGRTGRWFATDHEDVVPDILVTAKHLAAAYAPLAAVTVPDTIYAAFARDPFLGGLRHGHTTGGHAIACAAALAVLDVVESEGLIDRSAAVGEMLAATLEDARGIPGVRDVRGRGLLLGVEFESVDMATAVAAATQDGGVLVRQFGPVLALAPPLVISDDDATHGAAILLDACAMAASGHRAMA
jgi:adenosylmethionine-8-amino-7-oxononanoate aminotransferase